MLAVWGCMQCMQSMSVVCLYVCECVWMYAMYSSVYMCESVWKDVSKDMIYQWCTRAWHCVYMITKWYSFNFYIMQHNKYTILVVMVTFQQLQMLFATIYFCNASSQMAYMYYEYIYMAYFFYDGTTKKKTAEISSSINEYSVQFNTCQILDLNLVIYSMVHTTKKQCCYNSQWTKSIQMLIYLYHIYV